jgi:aqualysin 1
MLPSPWSLGFVLSAVAGALLVPGCRPQDGPAGPSESAETSSPQFASSRFVPDQYIVVFRKDASDPEGLARKLVASAGGELKYTYSAALKGFAGRIPPQALDGIRHNPLVDYIEADRVVRADDIESNAPWGLDRIDQTTLPLNGNYNYAGSGAGVHVYIIDTGIRTSHLEFGGRASADFSSVADGIGAEDCAGHGTHVAGTVGGRTYGVAKGVRLHSVRVLDCNGNGTYSSAIAGVDWITANRIMPAVANMSLTGSATSSLNQAVENSIASGVAYAVAAGNGTMDACSFSPASAPNALTIGATTATDLQAAYSNYGSCVDLYAPGSFVLSAYAGSDTATRSASGTSMASPHVAGAAALYLETHPSATPAQTTQALTASATSGVIQALGAGSPNLLLYTGSNSGPIPPPPADTVPQPEAPPQPLPDQAPVASFTSSCPRGQCTFDAAASSDDHGIVSYGWDFGDGSSAVAATSARAVHTYTTRGWYTVTLTVTDNAGKTGQLQQAVKINKVQGR